MPPLNPVECGIFSFFGGKEKQDISTVRNACWGFLLNPPKRYIPVRYEWHELRSNHDLAMLE
jgi:hypothetical protein